MANLFLLKETVTLVHLGIGAHQTCELLLDGQECFFVCLSVLVGVLFCEDFCVKHAWGEVLGVQDAHFFFVD